MRSSYSLFFLLLLLVLASLSGHKVSTVDNKPRVLILTDISSLQAGQGEPDDGQSLIRLMLYTNQLSVEGLIATSNLGHGQVARSDLIRQVVAAYDSVWPMLRQHDSQFPPAEQLRTVIKAGQPIAGLKVPLLQSIGPDRNTEASDWIIRVVDRPDPRPVWVCIWGGSTDLAQALYRISQTRSPAAVQAFIRKLRVHAVYDQDATGSWIREQFPQLQYILRHHGIRGMYRGGETTLVDSLWVETNIRRNRGALGALYVNYRGGDIWSRRLGGVKGIKEGDTPSFLSLIPNGLSVAERPELGGWGGRFYQQTAGLYGEVTDSTANFGADPDPRMAAVYRWRSAWQADFAARLTWCVQPYKQANHSPVVVINNQSGSAPVEMRVKAGQTVRLNARQSFDPDRQPIAFVWSLYPASRFLNKLDGQTTAVLTVQIPAEASGSTIPLLLTVADNGTPRLYGYRRILLRVD